MTDIEIPKDDATSRLHRPPKTETPDDFASAAERIEAFWAKHPTGSILPEVESGMVEGGMNPPYRVFTVRAYIRKDSQSDRPDSVAHATRGENDPDPVTAQFPQETAETSAISRALRNLGILPHGKPPTPDPTPDTAYATRTQHPLAVARRNRSWSQKMLAAAMIQRGHDWSQTIISKVENGHRALHADEVADLVELVGYSESP